MKILIPTAKEMNVSDNNFSFKKLSKKTLSILEILNEYTVEQLSKIYKINIKQAKLEKERISNINKKTAKTYTALYLFNGLMYRNINRFNISKEEYDYLKANVFITSSFYGIINVYDCISEHRLDFLQSIKVNNKNLKSFWRDDFDNFVKNEDVVISLLSSEFEEVFSKNIRDNFVKIVFMENKNGDLKTHSTISKKARGKFLSKVVLDNIKNLDDIKKISFDDFVYEQDLSSSKRLVFVKY